MDASQDRGSTKIEPRGAICLVQWPQLALLLECATVLCVCACMICVVCGLNISATSEFVKNKVRERIYTRQGATKLRCQLLYIMPTQHIIQGNNQPPPPVSFHCHLLTIARSWLASRLSSRKTMEREKKSNTIPSVTSKATSHPIKNKKKGPKNIYFYSAANKHTPKNIEVRNKLTYLVSLVLRCLKRHDEQRTWLSELHKN